MRISDWSSDVCSSDLGASLEAGDLGHHEADLSGVGQGAHARDGIGRGAVVGPPVHQDDAGGHRLQVQRPVERRVAAAGDDEMPADRKSTRLNSRPPCAAAMTSSAVNQYPHYITGQQIAIQKESK